VFKSLKGSSVPSTASTAAPRSAPFARTGSCDRRRLAQGAGPSIGRTSAPHRPRPRSLPPASGAVRSPDPTRHRVILGGDRR
jgi:hypothetical protein